MYKYIKAYELGFIEGIKDALKEENKKFKKINELDIMSKLYDVGYINGYIKCINYLKKQSLNY